MYQNHAGICQQHQPNIALILAHYSIFTGDINNTAMVIIIFIMETPAHETMVFLMKWVSVLNIIAVAT